MGAITSPIQLSEGAMRKLRREANKVAITIPKVDNQFRIFGVTLRTLSAGIQSVVGGLIGFHTITQVAGWAHEGIIKFAELEKRMRILATVSREAGQDIGVLSRTYMEAASEAADRFGLSVMDTSRALDSLVRAGLSSSDAVKALNAVLAISISEGIDAAQVADMMASTLAQFSLRAEEAERAADALTNAAAIGVSTMSQYGIGLSYVGAVAHQLGYSLEETLAALVKVDASIKDAAKSGRYLQAMFSALATKADELGFSIYDANGKLLPLSEIIRRLVDHLRSMGSESERNAYLFKIFGDQGARAVAALIDLNKTGEENAEILREIEQAVSKAGTAMEVAGEAMDTTAGKIAKMNRWLEKLQLNWGEAMATVINTLWDWGEAMGRSRIGTEQWMEAQKKAAETQDWLDQSLSGVNSDLKRQQNVLNKLNNTLNESLDSHEKLGESMEDMDNIISRLASKFGLEGETVAAVANQLFGLNIVYDEYGDLVDRVSKALGINEEQARSLIQALIEKSEAVKQAKQAQEEYENVLKTTYETLQSSLTAIVNYGAVYGPLTSNINKARDALAKFKELGVEIPDSLQKALDKVKELDDRLRDFKTRAEGLGGVGEVAGIGEAFLELRKSFREEEVAPKIRKLQDEIDELSKRLEEWQNNTTANKKIRELQIEQLEKEIEKRRQQIEELKKSAEYTAVEAETLQNLGIIQKTISFQTQVMSLYQTGLRLAMMGATEAGQGMMQAALDLASALEDGIVTDEEKKKILEELGVQFDETGKPVLSLKDIMKSFQDQVKDNITAIGDLMKAMKELDGLESHIYIYRHEITVHGERRIGARHEHGITIREGEQAAPGLQFGAWFTREGLYYLHRGEMVLPRNVAEWFRRGGGEIGSKVIVNNKIIINNPTVRSEADLDELAEKISRKMVSRLRVMT